MKYKTVLSYKYIRMDIRDLLQKEQPFFYQKNSPQIALYHGDCLDLLKQIPSKSIDVVFADPPYNLSNDGSSMHAGKRVSVNKGSWDKSRGVKEDFAFHRKWIKACKRVLKDTGTMWISGTYHSIYQCGFALQHYGYHILNEISWYKPNAAPNIACRMFAASHETLIWAKKDKNAKHYFDYQAMKHGEWKEDRLKNPGKQMRSVWALNTPGVKEKVHGKHPTQKPLALLERIVKASVPSNEDAIVLDPFTGSSTTGIASLKNGVHFMGFDSQKEYLNLSKKRIKEVAV